METRALIRTDKNGTAYYNVVYPCYACRGTGYRPEYAHVEGGVCFECGGSGRCETTEKVYTEEYLQHKADLAERREERRRASWTVEGALEKMGYGEMIGIVTDTEGRTLYGADFEWLTKIAGCKYEKGCSGLLCDASRSVIEHAALPDTPKYLVVPVKWDELLEADYESCELRWKEKGARTAVKNHTYSFPPRPKFESNFVGAVGDKVSMTLRLTHASAALSPASVTPRYTPLRMTATTRSCGRPASPSATRSATLSRFPARSRNTMNISAKSKRSSPAARSLPNLRIL